MPGELHIRAMTRAEVGRLVGWAAAEGWNPGLNDAELFWQADPEAFIAAELDGDFIGGGSIVSYAGAFGFMGLFIIRADMRGQGLGGQLWQARLERLKARLAPSATIGMDGVFEMQDWYARGGFVFAHRSIRYRSPGATATLSPGILPLADVPFGLVAAYDRACFPAPRERFLSTWVAQPDCRALAIADGDELRGFGVARRCGEGAKVGPLFADDRDAAEALFDALAAIAPGEPIYLDVPENNPAGMALAADRGMVEVFGTARMYLGPPPPLRNESIFGITTFELG